MPDAPGVHRERQACPGTVPAAPPRQEPDTHDAGPMAVWARPGREDYDRQLQRDTFNQLRQSGTGWDSGRGVLPGPDCLFGYLPRGAHQVR